MSENLSVFLIAIRIGQGGTLLSANVIAVLHAEHKVLNGRLWRHGGRWRIGWFDRWLAGDLYYEILRRSIERAEIGEGRLW